MLPSSGTLSMVERTLSDSRPAMAKLWPSPRRTVVSLWREVRPGMKMPAGLDAVGRVDVAHLGRQLEVDGALVEDRGREASWMPNFFHCTLTAPSAVESGMGNSPPARNFASCPERVTSVGSASTLASPFSSRRLSVTLNGNGVADPKKSWKACPSGAVGNGGRLARRGPVRGTRSPACRGRCRGCSPGRPCRPTCCAVRRAPEEVDADLLAGRSRETSANLTSSCTWWLPLTVIRFATCLACSRATSAMRSGVRRSSTSPESTTRSPAAETRDVLLREELLELPAQGLDVARHLQRDDERHVVLVPEGEVGGAGTLGGEQELVRRDHLEVGDARVGDRDARDRPRRA